MRVSDEACDLIPFFGYQRCCNFDAFDEISSDPNVTRCEDGELHLLEAAMRGSERAMHIILIHGASVTVTDALGNTALHWAAITGNVYCVHLLLQYRIPKDSFNSSQFTALMRAVYLGNINVVRYPIWRGASTTPELNHRTESALTFVSLMPMGQLLHAAICGGNESIVCLLLYRGANVEDVDQHGYTPLMVATRRRNVDMVRALITAGADISAVLRVTNETAFSLAQKRGYTEISPILLECPAIRIL
ncbi:Ankyrin repeat and KH domain-containing protein mask [Echinococcus granulosus]|uniref:Ankyrin repeat and KH domain-containing protein mask n=1 Tax=Echinococcus granulosus TaxID=6210 RepID=W6U9W8_ECHGR|nr:Ankyrin repeat and KH domain-containing protein mask [Echinococcus granulosus]EUB58178.1 Ankyrin repeat and KH domain-containing protein mask [Echinococcus granulosus]